MVGIFISPRIMEPDKRDTPKNRHQKGQAEEAEDHGRNAIQAAHGNGDQTIEPLALGVFVKIDGSPNAQG